MERKESSSSLWKRMVLELSAGGIANAIASIILNPCDVVKVRIQTQGQGNLPIVYRSTLDAARQIVKSEGIFTLNGGGLWMPGLLPSVLRELSYSSFRFGLYSPTKSFFSSAATLGNSSKGTDSSDVGFAIKIASGATSGALGSVLATPTDLVKIRYQSEAGRICNQTGKYLTGLHRGRKPTYRSTLDAFRQIYISEGATGLWRGWQPTMGRAAFLAAAQLSTYDHTKYLLLSQYSWVEDGIALHIFGSLLAALAALAVTQPFDTIKSRVMAANSKSGTPITPVQCTVETFRNEGFSGLYRGSLASYVRFGPHFVISLPLWEQVRFAMGLGYLS